MVRRHAENRAMWWPVGRRRKGKQAALRGDAALLISSIAIWREDDAISAGKGFQSLPVLQVTTTRRSMSP
jgi:hypothetical protein